MEKQNKLLKTVSKTIFGKSAVLMIVNPKSLTLLKQNARYFKKETFKQLVANIKDDQRLSSVPLCHSPKKDVLEVLSGNHRVEAAIQAGVEWILIILALEKMTKSKKISVQLSHNALAGLDDPNVLADLWAKIDDIKEKLYAGLSSDAIKEIENIKLVTFTTPQVYTKTMTFAFTEPEKENIEHILEELNKAVTGETHLAHMEQFEDFFNTLQKIKQKEDIKNSSLAVIKMMEMVTGQLKEGE
jgi:ParB-like nuclease family protein